MQCPFCDHSDTKVIDARSLRDAPVKRRRRACSECGRRFTTYERIEDLMPLVVKRDGRRESFDRAKIRRGIQKACDKRPVSASAQDEAVARIERAILDRGEREVRALSIGEETRAELRQLDPVAWLRFTSVYLNFRSIEEFRRALDEMDEAD
ncbi:MAG: transcriptional regulator NrdR [Myxococcota bacterium]